MRSKFNTRKSLRSRGKTLGISKSKKDTLPKKQKPTTSFRVFTPEENQNSSFFTNSDKILCNSIMNLILFLQDQTVHIPFEGHDMVQRYLCAIYQVPYPSKIDNKYTIGRVDGKKDSQNSGALVHDLIQKYIYCQNNGIQKFNNRIIKGLGIIEGNPNHFDLPVVLIENSKEKAAHYITSKFLEIGKDYKLAVLNITLVLKQNMPTYNKIVFFKGIKLEADDSRDNSQVKRTGSESLSSTL